MFTVQQGTDQYRIVAPNGDASELTEYGDVAELETGGKCYIALVDVDEENPDEMIYMLRDWVMCVTAEPAEVEDVEFDGDEAVEAEVSDGDGEDGDEDVEVED